METNPQTEPKTAPQSVVIPPDPADILKNKDLAAISYLWVFSLVLLIARRESPFVRFHARQAVVLFALSIAVWFVPYLGRLLELPIILLAVLGFATAAQGQWKELPIIGPLASGHFSNIIPSIKFAKKDFLALFTQVTTILKQKPKAAAPVVTVPSTPSASTPSTPSSGVGASPSVPSDHQ